jgi:hypothetical protein
MELQLITKLIPIQLQLSEMLQLTETKDVQLTRAFKFNFLFSILNGQLRCLPPPNTTTYGASTHHQIDSNTTAIVKDATADRDQGCATNKSLQI